MAFIFQLICFTCTTWKLKQTMEQQPHRTWERRKSKQKQNQVKSHWNLPCGLLFDLAHTQCNGIIKGWFHCLTSESKGRFLVNNSPVRRVRWLFVNFWCHHEMTENNHNHDFVVHSNKMIKTIKHFWEKNICEAKASLIN